jgi:hypothetical protein
VNGANYANVVLRKLGSLSLVLEKVTTADTERYGAYTTCDWPGHLRSFISLAIGNCFKAIKWKGRITTVKFFVILAALSLLLVTFANGQKDHEGRTARQQKTLDLDQSYWCPETGYM